jgi:hypothetical protein
VTSDGWRVTKSASGAQAVTNCSTTVGCDEVMTGNEPVWASVSGIHHWSRFTETGGFNQ